MHLIVLYGPPASGKYTVGKELTSIIGYRFLHNHLISDLAHSIFEFGTPEYEKLATDIRIMVVEAAIRGKIPGLILTFAYGLETKEGKRDEAVLKDLAMCVKQAKGRVSFVRLVSSRGDLVKRVGALSRKRFGKLRDPRVLNNLLNQYDLEREISFAKSFVINTSRSSPKSAAEKVKKLCLKKSTLNQS